MLDTLKQYCIGLIQWLLDSMASIIDAMLLPIVDLIPDLEISSRWSSIVQYLSWANKWVPLDLVCLLLIAFITIFLSVNLINWILGLIPTIN